MSEKNLNSYGGLLLKLNSVCILEKPKLKTPVLFTVEKKINK